MQSTRQIRQATWLVAAAVCAALAGAPALAFDASFTSSVRSSGQTGVEGCRSQPNDQRQECVANELDRVANKLRRKPDYIDARDAFRSAAASVRQASSPAAAASAVQAARSELLRASGEAAHHYQELAQVMDTARSVLRS